jgi:hypothetical protein
LLHFNVECAYSRYPSPISQGKQFYRIDKTWGRYPYLRLTWHPTRDSLLCAENRSGCCS